MLQKIITTTIEFSTTSSLKLKALTILFNTLGFVSFLEFELEFSDRSKLGAKRGLCA